MRKSVLKAVPFAALALLPVAVGCDGAAAGSGSGDAGSLLPPTIESPVLGILNGEELTLEDLSQNDRVQLARLRNDYFTEAHRILEGGTLRAARERLLIEAAEAEGMTLNQYYNESIGIPEVSDEEVERIYEQNRQQLGGRSLDDIRVDLGRQIANQKLNREIDLAGSRMLAEAEWDLTVPAYRLEVETEGHAALGPEDAPVELVVFSDFECPFCKRFNGAVDQLREEYPDRVRIVFRHFPLRNIHPQAQKAAEASVCAQDQDRFWDYHDALWAGDDFSPETLHLHARLLGLDPEEFSRCLDSGRHYDRVQADLNSALDLGQTGTPAVFANGRYLGGALSFEQLREEIEKDLAEAN